MLASAARTHLVTEDMAGNRWRGSVVMRIGVFDGTLLIIDGIHRGIAYLVCVEKRAQPGASSGAPCRLL